MGTVWGEGQTIHDSSKKREYESSRSQNTRSIHQHTQTWLQEKRALETVLEAFGGIVGGSSGFRRQNSLYNRAMRTKGAWWKATLLGWVVVVLVGCTSRDQAAVGATPPPSSQTNTVTLTVHPTLTPVPTWTPLPPTLTPLPTLPPDEAEDLVLELLETNGGCQLPCWWGILPSTSWDQARQYLNRFAMVRRTNTTDEMLSAEFLYNVPEEISQIPLKHIYHIVDGKIDFVELRTGKYPKYKLPNFLVQNGIPTDVLVDTFPEPINGDLPLSILFFYSKKGILAYFETQARIVNENVVGCFTNVTLAGLFLWPPDQQMSLMDITSQPISFDFWFSPFNQLEELTGLTVEQFYDRFSLIDERFTFKDSLQCLSIPIENLPSQ